MQHEDLGATHAIAASFEPGPAFLQLRQRLAKLPPAEWHAEAVGYVSDLVRYALVDRDLALDPGEPLRNVGVDSLTAVEVMEDIAQASGIRIPAALLEQATSIRDLADCLVAGLREQGAGDGEGIVS